MNKPIFTSNSFQKIHRKICDYLGKDVVLTKCGDQGFNVQYLCVYEPYCVHIKGNKFIFLSV